MLVCVFKFWWERSNYFLANSVVVVIFKSLCKESLKLNNKERVLLASMKSFETPELVLCLSIP